MTFGKWKGTDISKIDKSYLQWLSHQENISPELAQQVDAVIRGVELPPEIEIPEAVKSRPPHYQKYWWEQEKRERGLEQEFMAAVKARNISECLRLKKLRQFPY